MNDELQEYTVFKVTDKDGNEVEMAVIDEFEFEHKSYVAASLIEGDEINEDGVYIYKLKLSDDDFEVDKILDSDEYKRIAEAYINME